LGKDAPETTSNKVGLPTSTQSLAEITVKTTQITLLILLTIIIACKKERKTVIEFSDGSKEIKYFRNQNDTSTYLREFYYSNGILGTKGLIVSGKMDSVWNWYYSNGRIQNYAFLDKGLYIRERWQWYSNGLVEQIDYISKPCETGFCDGTVLYYDSLGLLHQKVEIKNGMRQDSFIQFWENGNPFIISAYKDDIQSGFYNEFHRNKAKWVKGQFVNGKKEGRWEWYDTLGVLTKIHVFNNDHPIQ